MAKVVPFSSLISTYLIILLFTGCANRARDLPPDQSHLPPAERLLSKDKESSEYVLTCYELKAELDQTRNSLVKLENELYGVQAKNQSAGLVGILAFPPAMLAMNNNQKMVTEYRKLDEKRERILRIENARQCQKSDPIN